jgi:hypothetical protein
LNPYLAAQVGCADVATGELGATLQLLASPPHSIAAFGVEIAAARPALNIAAPPVINIAAQHTRGRFFQAG